MPTYYPDTGRRPPRWLRAAGLNDRGQPVAPAYGRDVIDYTPPPATARRYTPGRVRTPPPPRSTLGPAVMDVYEAGRRGPDLPSGYRQPAPGGQPQANAPAAAPGRGFRPWQVAQELVGQGAETARGLAGAVMGANWQPADFGDGGQLAGGAGNPQGGGGRGYADAPGWADPRWYKEFQDEHQGATPEQFYARTNEGPAEALADRAFGDQFAREHGRAPTDREWEDNWYNTRASGRPTFSPEQWKVIRRMGRAGRGGGGRKEPGRGPLVVTDPVRWRINAG